MLCKAIGKNCVSPPQLMVSAFTLGHRLSSKTGTACFVRCHCQLAIAAPIHAASVRSFFPCSRDRDDHLDPGSHHVSYVHQQRTNEPSQIWTQLSLKRVQDSLAVLTLAAGTTVPRCAVTLARPPAHVDRGGGHPFSVMTGGAHPSGSRWGSLYPPCHLLPSQAAVHFLLVFRLTLWLRGSWRCGEPPRGSWSTGRSAQGPLM